MLLLFLGVVVFLGVHLLPTRPAVRASLVERLGHTGYQAMFSLLSLAGLVIIIYGYHKLQLNPGKNPELWDPPVWTKHIAFVLMIPAMIALVAAYVPSNIRTRLKHPMLVGIKIWALAHLLANGDLGSLLLFGSFLAYAVYDRITLKYRSGGRGPLGDAKGGITGDVTAVALGLALWAFMLLWGHQYLIGKALIG